VRVFATKASFGENTEWSVVAPTPSRHHDSHDDNQGSFGRFFFSRQQVRSDGRCGLPFDFKRWQRPELTLPLIPTGCKERQRSDTWILMPKLQAARSLIAEIL
jgi:hypothetical protein